MYTSDTQIKQTIKTGLRISHNKLDDEIDRQIITAKSELVRVGVSPAKVAAPDELITEAIRVYALKNMTESVDLIELYDRAWVNIVDGIRKSGGYHV